MKRVAFAWVTEIIDFDTKESAIKYVSDNWSKDWCFTRHNMDDDHGYGFGCYVYKNGNDDYKYSVEVCKKYGNYNPGW